MDHVFFKKINKKEIYYFFLHAETRPSTNINLTLDKKIQVGYLSKKWDIYTLMWDKEGYKTVTLGLTNPDNAKL